MNQPVARTAAVARFSCLGADCPDTCCRGWDIPADARQIALMQATIPQLLTTIDHETYTMRREGPCGECNQFIAGVCGLQASHGSDYLSDSCHFYPRIAHTRGGEIHLNGAISCPEMLRLMLTLPKPFAPETATTERLPLHPSTLDYSGIPESDAATLMAQCVALAADASQSPESIMSTLLARAWALEGDTLPQAAPQPGDAHAIYYALALTKAFGDTGISQRLPAITQRMATALDCSFDRETRNLTLGPNAGSAYITLRHRWQTDAAVATTPALRRYIQAQLAMTAFPFSPQKDTTIKERAAMLVQRFATTRLALMCHVTENGIPPDEEKIIEVVQAIARLLDHLVDTKLTRMIHRDSGWTDASKLHGLIF
ncbi:MAG: flagellin lysine-N-methylase [Rickettsiales bacterium]